MIHNKEWKVIETLEKLSKSSDATVAKTSKKALWTIKGHEGAITLYTDTSTSVIFYGVPC